MNRLEVLGLLEEGKITLEKAMRELAKPDRPPAARPVWRLLVKVESREGRFTLWLPWAPLVLLAGLALPFGWGAVKRHALDEHAPASVGLWQVLALLAQVSVAGGGLLVDARSSEGERVRVAL